MTNNLIAIINNCKGKYERYSKQDIFGFEQIVKLTLQEMQDNIALRKTHIGKHKGKYYPVDMRNVNMAYNKYTSRRVWQGQPDLDCDDPLYDGNPVF